MIMNPLRGKQVMTYERSITPQRSQSGSLDLCPSQAIPGVGAHPHTPRHHRDTQGRGAPDLSDDQGWAPAPTYP